MTLNIFINLINDYAGFHPKQEKKQRKIVQSAVDFLFRDVVCHSKIKSLTSKREVEVIVTESLNEEGLKVYAVWRDLRCLGKIELDTLEVLSSGVLGSSLHPEGVYEQLVGYGDGVSQPVKKIYIEDLESFYRKQYSGVGSLLISMAHRESAVKGCAGKIMTYAIDNSPGFYYKCGFHHVNKETDALIDRTLSKAKKKNRFPDTRTCLGEMYYKSPS
jgi:hypothetical protein